jgi:hypothetical protein
MECAGQVVIPNANALYEAPIDIEIFKACFAREHNVQVLYIDTERKPPLRGCILELESKALAASRFILCYNLEHACVLTRERNSLLLFDSLQFSELSKFIQDHYKGGLPLRFADEETGFVHSAVQLDRSSCLPISLLYIALRCGSERDDHGTAVSKLKRLMHYQIREMAFTLLGLLKNAPA